MAYETIGDFRDLHRDKGVFILASGPSLATLDLTPLRRRIVIGLNRSSLIFPDTHYHCTMDDRLFREYGDLLRKSRYLFTFEDRPFGIPLRLLGSEGFSYDLSRGIYSGYTVSYFALQLAVWMGFTRVCFLGLDLCHDGGRTHFFGVDDVSRNHEQTEFPKMIRMMEYAADQLAGTRVQVCTCSPTSTLDCFERVSYEQALRF
jgi:hypothetical protein